MFPINDPFSESMDLLSELSSESKSSTKDQLKTIKNRVGTSGTVYFIYAVYHRTTQHQMDWVNIKCPT